MGKRGNIQVKNPVVAALLSFFWTGLGQIYNGELFKGLISIIVQIVNIFLMIIIIGFLTFAIVWLWGIYDAYTTAEDINKGLK